MSLTLGDLLQGIKGMMTPTASPAPTTANMPQLNASYQQYAMDEMTAGRTPLPFAQWVAQQQAAQRQ